ncbi:allantoate amidohydrolase [Thiomicrorhabdus indica]|uniref:allantoate amidohydrolase n=1 Tax=Thiomicrorhabdus indica TaxID=2267253 RepID=UPI002AA6DC05|nr:allantoate amidohydrolase [Thiomicrorhabdus indica]
MSKGATSSKIIQRCDELARVSDIPDSISRVFLGPSYKDGLKLVNSWMLEEGLETYFDPVGNLIGRLACDEEKAPTLMIGSHLDTVPNAGRFDGILGVMVGLDVVYRIQKENLKLPFHLEIIGIGDEEGVSFNASMLGSKALVDGWNDSTLELMNTEGKTLHEALVDQGFDADNYQQASRKKDNLIGYWEVHMEQGPVLEKEELPIGIVTAIAGARRFKVTVEGDAGHAGTVPMNLRHDALTTAAEIILMIEKQAQQNGIVATVGKLNCYPNAVNVIPGTVEFTVDIRSEDDALRERIMNLVFMYSEGMGLQRNVQVYWNEYHFAPATQCHPEFRVLFEQAIAEQGIHVRSLVSGAGHDAMTLAAITNVAMLFVRCKGGISHHPDEYVSQEDADIASETIFRALIKLASQYQD